MKFGGILNRGISTKTVSFRKSSTSEAGKYVGVLVRLPYMYSGFRFLSHSNHKTVVVLVLLQLRS